MRAKKEPMVNQSDCQHPEWRRYGNKSGSFSQCLLCHQVRKWNTSLEKWELAGKPSSRKSSLPVPSSSNTLPAPPRSTTSKARARPQRSSAAPSMSTTIPPLEDGGYQEDLVGLGADLISEELSHRAFLRQQGLLEEYERQQQQIIEDGMRARMRMDHMDFEETGSQLEIWDWEEEDHL